MGRNLQPGSLRNQVDEAIDHLIENDGDHLESTACQGAHDFSQLVFQDEHWPFGFARMVFKAADGQLRVTKIEQHQLHP
jgi:hypothetical protein